jgi:uncharacterized protein YpuA (DUF1002 family)
MSRKTKKEKLASQLRRLRQSATPTVSQVEQIQPSSSLPIPSTTVSLKDLQINKTAATASKSEGVRYDYSHILGDLKKIGILILASISFEVLVNLTIRTSFAKLILRTFGIEI